LISHESGRREYTAGTGQERSAKNFVEEVMGELQRGRVGRIRRLTPYVSCRGARASGTRSRLDADVRAQYQSANAVVEFVTMSNTYTPIICPIEVKETDLSVFSFHKVSSFFPTSVSKKGAGSNWLLFFPAKN